MFKGYKGAKRRPTIQASRRPKWETRGSLEWLRHPFRGSSREENQDKWTLTCKASRHCCIAGKSAVDSWKTECVNICIISQQFYSGKWIQTVAINFGERCFHKNAHKSGNRKHPCPFKRNILTLFNVDTTLKMPIC